MEFDKKILKQTEEYVTHLYEGSKQTNLLYHSLDHVKNVVTRCFEIASHYELSEKDLFVLHVAAWFHDTGHLYTGPAEHEDKSIELMTAFLKGKNIDEPVIQEVADCIAATKLTNKPSGLLQEIIRDADSYHFGTKEFKKTNKLIKKEYELRGYNTMLLDWDTNTMELLKDHNFYTSYARETLANGKDKNLQRVIKKAHQLKNSNSGQMIFMDENGENPKLSKDQNALITKGIQTSLRLTSQNHLKLSDMADRKANILISVNALIISLILSVMMRKIDVESHLTIPTFLFLGFSLATIIISIIATRPNITAGSFSREDVLQKRTNLLFFGNFYKSSLEEYRWGMSTMMRDPDYLYGSLVQDIYFLGIVLSKKYKLLRIAYNLFMIGIIISVLAFTVAFIFHKPDGTTVINTSVGSPFNP